MRRSLPKSAKLKTHRKCTPTTSCAPSQSSTEIFPDPLPETESEELQSFCKNAVGDRNRQAVIKAMEQCAPNRRIWIEEKKPFLSDILRKFPRFLDIPELVSVLVLSLKLFNDYQVIV